MSERPYSRVYWAIAEDTKFDGIRDDMRLMGSWLTLLVAADMAYPVPAYIPRIVSLTAVKKLVDAGLVDILSHSRFRVHGLEAERQRRSQTASQNATLRWERTKVDGGKPASRRTRFKVLERDGWTCRYCGRSAPDVVLDVDHIVPVREGGSDDMDNLVSACVDCNAGKSGHPLRAQPVEHARASEGASAPNARRGIDEDETRHTPRADEDDDGRADLEAFLLVKRRAPSPAQRKVLDDVLAVHDVTGPQWAADIITRNPNDPIGAVIEADREWRAERMAAARKAETPKPTPRRPKGALTGINAELAALLRAKDEGDAA